MLHFGELIDRREGLISNEVFSEGVYRRELERVFGRTWLFVGHDSMIPRPHDYITNFMGVDPVIVQRDKAGKVRVYLNKCRHRGPEVCIYESGNARSFTCSYHGWTYNDGALVGMPFADETYLGELDRRKYALVEAKVAQCGGLIFASWDSNVMALDDYLGDVKWYLENFLLHEDMGGLEALPGVQRYMMPTNWKLLAENFAGDDYHFMETHGSTAKLLSKNQRTSKASSPGQKTDDHIFSVCANFRKGPPHGLLEVRFGPESFIHDMRLAEQLGSEAVEWLKEHRRRIEERIKRYKVKPYSFHVGNIFPNFALIGPGSALYANSFILHHPSSLLSTEVWQWCLVDKNAPAAVKERQKYRLLHGQAAAGMVAPDDHENFARIGKNLRTPIARGVPFHYGMAINHEDDDVRPIELREGEKIPGHIVPRFSEASQRDFYRYWAELMGET